MDITITNDELISQETDCCILSGCVPDRLDTIKTDTILNSFILLDDF